MKSLIFALLLGGVGALRALAAEPPAVALSVTTEDGKKMLVATVTANGKPVENAKVEFFARRTFGQIVLGAEATLDDGTAAVLFPVTLPGDDRGRLQVSAEVAGFGQPRPRAEAVLDGGVPFRVEPAAFPRALWAPQAPYVLLANIAIVVGLIWGAFAYGLFQLASIRRESVRDEPPARASTFPTTTSQQ